MNMSIRRAFRVLLAASTLVVAGCASTSTVSLDADTIEIAVHVGTICDANDAARLARRQAAVETIRRGFDEFVVFDSVRGDHPVDQPPVTARTTLYGDAATPIFLPRRAPRRTPPGADRPDVSRRSGRERSGGRRPHHPGRRLADGGGEGCADHVHRGRRLSHAAPTARGDVTARPRVGLLVTCLVDLFRPSIGFAAVKLLEDAGCDVDVPAAQTCCGQPAYNSGDAGDTRAIAKRTIEAFEPFDHVVAPSGSCAGMLREHYPRLFPTGADWHARARSLADRTHELASFLTDVLGVREVDARFEAHATYHDSCSGLREMKVRDQPRDLLASVDGLRLTEMKDAGACCGFGGTFCVKYPEISTRVVDEKCANVRETGAGVLLGGDLGCLLNIAGRLARRSHPVRVFHVAEVLAGMAGRSIGEPGR